MQNNIKESNMNLICTSKETNYAVKQFRFFRTNIV